MTGNDGPTNVDAWLDALVTRHASTMARSEFLKAIRALSARYVERRSVLPDRSPLDSAGKRAAFAGFYAPLHFLTMRAIVRALELGSAPVETIVDLGCGTAISAIAWACEFARPPGIEGVDRNAWALDEARHNCRELGLAARIRRGDLVDTLEELAAGRAHPGSRTGQNIVLGWSLNELTRDARDRAERAIHALAARNTGIVIVEPIGRRLVPWWDDTATRAERAGARCDEWRFDQPLPPALAALDRDAGFERDGLTARSLVWK